MPLILPPQKFYHWLLQQIAVANTDLWGSDRPRHLLNPRPMPNKVWRSTVSVAIDGGRNRNTNSLQVDDELEDGVESYERVSGWRNLQVGEELFLRVMLKVRLVCSDHQIVGMVDAAHDDEGLHSRGRWRIAAVEVRLPLQRQKFAAANANFAAAKIKAEEFDGDQSKDDEAGKQKDAHHPSSSRALLGGANPPFQGFYEPQAAGIVWQEHPVAVLNISSICHSFNNFVDAAVPHRSLATAGGVPALHAPCMVLEPDDAFVFSLAGCRRRLLNSALAPLTHSVIPLQSAFSALRWFRPSRNQAPHVGGSPVYTCSPTSSAPLFAVYASTVADFRVQFCQKPFRNPVAFPARPTQSPPHTFIIHAVAAVDSGVKFRNKRFFVSSSSWTWTQYPAAATILVDGVIRILMTHNPRLAFQLRYRPRSSAAQPRLIPYTTRASGMHATFAILTELCWLEPILELVQTTALDLMIWLDMYFINVCTATVLRLRPTWNPLALVHPPLILPFPYSGKVSTSSIHTGQGSYFKSSLASELPTTLLCARFA
ncbi:hypothetical protein C8R45DRAFT_947121 [Mycena sanguinolenta]|nr:hypothetical protein C8R45DRAFT_947121 [Mycena sanguinolenta]